MDFRNVHKIIHLRNIMSTAVFSHVIIRFGILLVQSCIKYKDDFIKTKRCFVP